MKVDSHDDDQEEGDGPEANVMRNRKKEILYY